MLISFNHLEQTEGSYNDWLEDNTQTDRKVIQNANESI